MIADRYALEREVGRGGMGAVWLARDTVLDRPVALKRVGGLPGEADATDLTRILREARLAAALHHPHVVPVFDLVEDDGRHWLVMEYVDGPSLATLVRDRGPLAPDEVAALVRQLADALDAAHRAGIVHRDVKPSNVLVTGSGQVKLTDFGIARGHGDTTLTATGFLVGSPAYLAPEVVSGQPASPASDVWSLGATVYFALDGTPAYDTQTNLIGTLYKIVHEEPPRPAHAGWLEPLLAGTMAVDPQRRWTMAQVLDFLRRGPAAPAPPAGTEPTARLAPVEPPEATSPTRSGLQAVPPAETDRRRARPLVVLAAVAVVAAVLAATAWAFTRGQSDSSDGSGQGARSPVASASPTTTSASSSATPEATTEGMTAFVTTYLDTVTQDPAAGWEMLTPAFRRQSGSFGQYRQAWRSRPNAQVSNIEADPDAMTVSYDVSYSDAEGNPLFDDSVTLTLSYEDGSYRISGER